MSDLYDHQSHVRLVPKPKPTLPALLAELQHVMDEQRRLVHELYDLLLAPYTPDPRD